MSETNPPESDRPGQTGTPPASTAPASTPQSGVQPARLGDPSTQTLDVKLTVPLQAGERVLMFKRRHWMYLWPMIALNVVFAVVPVILAVKFFDLVGLSGGFLNIVYAVWLLVFVLRCLLLWYRYQNDTWAITNQRVIDSRRKSPFDLRVSTADLVNIQDMSVVRTGIFQTMLNYGDILCQTAAKEEEFVITGVPHPAEVQSLVDKERDRERMRGR